MTWFYGFWCKYRFAKRIGKEVGSRSQDPVSLVVVTDRYIRRNTDASFFVNTDCHQRAIIAFVDAKHKGDLSCLKSTSDQIKEIGRAHV